ncbi:mitochondrial cardiolipin hydrolase isoform X2 [Odontomachus brunneus]|uniref:mitochondrial cardiolipin hydrolase isoform X2 n=1 Tax=Odontomachus brunneus TaxID=486640 RepID=UPI0013F2AFFD|nr:mitochondrial cardiolipin hydrolase isoform X2 [Odontomachus brunneus]
MMKNIALVSGGALAVYIPQYLYRTYQCYLKKEESHDSTNSSTVAINEPRMYDVMFFTKKSSICRFHLNNDAVGCKMKHCPVKYLRKIKGYLDSATDSLYVCVFIITCPYLREAIIAAKKRGITVKIITDTGALMNISTKVALYESKGIEVRYVQQNSEETLMHHKFVVIDCHILITGSTNWTMSAFFGNFENLIVTNNPEVVEKYKQEFIKIWDELCVTYSGLSRVGV